MAAKTEGWPLEHRAEVACDRGVWLTCSTDLEPEPHWKAPLGHKPSLNQVAAAWAYHLQQEEGDRDG